jgi:ubiquitin carboxyl-terminal hydrolase 8
MNSAMQCLLNTQSLIEYFLLSDWSKHINRSNPLGKQGEIAESFGDLVNLIWFGGKEKEGSVVTPVNFKRTIGHHFLKFDNGRQHDAQELIAFLLDGLHEDLNLVTVKPKPTQESKSDDEKNESKDDEEVARLSWNDYLMSNKSIIVDLFQGQIRSTLRCLHCSSKSSKFDTFMYLSLPIRITDDNKSGRNTFSSRNSPSIDLQSLLHDYCKIETLRNESKWFCPKCKQHHDAEKALTFWSFPDIVIIHLKRSVPRIKNFYSNWINVE